MDVSIFLAQAFGLLFIVISLFMFFRYDVLREAIVEVVEDRGLLLIVAIGTLILGILLVLVHNIWVADWRVVITLLCWLVLFSGVVRLYHPDWVKKFALKFTQTKKSSNIMAFINFVLGLFFIWHGFF